MKKVFAALMVASLVCCVSATAQAEDGNVSQAALQDLGLGGFDTISDAEGEQIRGKFHLQVQAAAISFNNAINAQIRLQQAVGNVAAVRVLTNIRTSANVQYRALFRLGQAVH